MNIEMDDEDRQQRQEEPWNRILVSLQTQILPAQDLFYAPVPWHHALQVKTGSDRELEIFWSQVKDQTRHHTWTMMAEVIIRTLNLEAEKLQNLNSVKTHTDLKPFICWILQHQTTPFHITHLSHPEWDQLPRQLRGKYALLRFLHVKVKLSQVLKFVLRAQLKYTSFKDKASWDFHQSSSICQSPSMWIDDFETTLNQLPANINLNHHYLKTKGDHSKWIQEHWHNNEANITALIPFVGEKDLLFNLNTDMINPSKKYLELQKPTCEKWIFQKGVGEEIVKSYKIPSDELPFLDPSLKISKENNCIMTKVSVSAKISFKNRLNPNSDPILPPLPCPLQISFHPLLIHKLTRIAPVKKALSSELDFFTQNSSVQSTFELEWALRDKEQAHLIVDHYFKQNHHLCFESILKCSTAEIEPYKSPQQLTISYEFETLHCKDRQYLHYYLLSQHMCAHAEANLYRHAEQLYRQLQQGHPGSYLPFKVLYPNGVPF